MKLKWRKFADQLWCTWHGMHGPIIEAWPGWDYNRKCKTCGSKRKLILDE